MLNAEHCLLTVKFQIYWSLLQAYSSVYHWSLIYISNEDQGLTVFIKF